MKTAPVYTTHTYKLIAKNGGTSIYRTEGDTAPLTTELKITIDLGRAKTKTKHWLTEHDENGNYGQPTTALLEVGQIRWSYGDLESKKHFCLFEYRQDKKVQQRNHKTEILKSK
jgi:hypothetical protein